MHGLKEKFLMTVTNYLLHDNGERGIPIKMK